MSYLKIWSLALLMPCAIQAQKTNLYFHPKGSMINSQFTLDTVLPSNLPAMPIGIVFNTLNANSLATYPAFVPILMPFLQKNQKDSVQYFYLFNGTTQNVVINKRTQGRNSNIFAVEVAQTVKDITRPLSFLMGNRCITGSVTQSIIVQPQQILILKNHKPPRQGTFKTTAHLRLDTVSNGILISAPYPLSIDEFAFYINEQYENIKYTIQHGAYFLE
jgi:hypothetical protein